MNERQIAEIVNAVSYKPGWRLDFKYSGDRAYIQVRVDETADAAICACSGTRPYSWTGRKWFLSEHMCRQEIVGTCFAALKAAELHECAEWFRYKGTQIYNPHLDPDLLAHLIHNQALQTDQREDPANVK